VRSGVDVVVGTPGRITDFLERRTLDLRQLKHVVLDEVDRMLDMGFADSVDEILQHRYRRSMQHQLRTYLFLTFIPFWWHIPCLVRCANSSDLRTLSDSFRH